MTDPREANPTGGDPNTEATGDFQKPGTVGPSGESQPDDGRPTTAGDDQEETR